MKQVPAIPSHLPAKTSLLTNNKNINNTLLGYIDIAGNFILNIRGPHVDPYKEESLGFFKKMTYNDRIKELQGGIIFSLGNKSFKLRALIKLLLGFLREVCDTE